MMYETDSTVHLITLDVVVVVRIFTIKPESECNQINSVYSRLQSNQNAVAALRRHDVVPVGSGISIRGSDLLLLKYHIMMTDL